MVWSNKSTFFDMASGLPPPPSPHIKVPPFKCPAPAETGAFSILFFGICSISLYSFAVASCRRYISFSLHLHSSTHPLLVVVDHRGCRYAFFWMRMRKVFVMNWKNATHEQQQYGGLFLGTLRTQNTVTADSTKYYTRTLEIVQRKLKILRTHCFYAYRRLHTVRPANNCPAQIFTLEINSLRMKYICW